ncbi:hypothetical protein AC578_4100 [Pseudocercospora eumusae]|uniref:Uncharacterized protein n=1 Tax=Pseudocercospora eumusae TaxID=321146 RepID=A0A139HDH5_9PEZI|nr:hypothetical protein AC578_4100 [Pseudocercospora eumusae]
MRTSREHEDKFDDVNIYFTPTPVLCAHTHRSELIPTAQNLTTDYATAQHALRQTRSRDVCGQHMECDHLCKQRILYTNTDDAARMGVSLAMQAHQSGAWCNSQDWCQATINSTCSMITSKIVKEAIPALKTCDTECFINLMDNSAQKSTYWAASWADKALNTPSEGRTVEPEAVKRFKTTMQYLELIPADSIVNRTALDEVMKHSHALPLPVPDPVPARSGKGTTHGSGLEAWQVGLAAGLGAGVPTALGTGASAWLLGSWLYANNVRYALMVDNVVRESSWIRALFSPREVNALSRLTPEELLADEQMRIAEQAAKNIATQQSLRLRDKPETFENAFKEKLPPSPKDYPMERIFRTELYNEAKGVMENVFVKEIKAPMKNGYMYKQGFRRFRRCNVKGKDLLFRNINKDGEVYKSAFRDSWMKPGQLQPLNNAYWQNVAAEAGSALEGTTSILRTTDGIVLDSLGQAIPKIGDNIVNVMPVERVGNAVKFAVEKNTELAFEVGDLSAAAVDGAATLFGAAGGLLLIDVLGDGEGDDAPRFVKRPSPLPPPGHGDDSSASTTSHPTITHSSDPKYPTTSPESPGSGASSTYGTPGISDPMSTSYGSSSATNSSTPSSTFRTMPTPSTSSMVPNLTPPNSTSTAPSFPGLSAGLHDDPFASLPAGLQNDHSRPDTVCCSDYEFLWEAFRIQGINWAPDSLKSRIEHCGAVTAWEFWQTEEGTGVWHAQGNLPLQKLYPDDQKCLHEALMKAGGPDVKCKVNCDDFNFFSSVSVEEYSR